MARQRRWCPNIGTNGFLQGSITARQIRRIPAQILAAKERLLNHLCETEGDSQIDEDAIFEGYAGVFQSTDILALVDIIIEVLVSI